MHENSFACKALAFFVHAFFGDKSSFNFISHSSQFHIFSYQSFIQHALSPKGFQQLLMKDYLIFDRVRTVMSHKTLALLSELHTLNIKHNKNTHQREDNN